MGVAPCPVVAARGGQPWALEEGGPGCIGCGGAFTGGGSGSGGQMLSLHARVVVRVVLQVFRCRASLTWHWSARVGGDLLALECAGRR